MWAGADCGEWISRDPIAERGGLNLYGYVGNNPISAFDLFGLQSIAPTGFVSQEIQAQAIIQNRITPESYANQEVARMQDPVVKTSAGVLAAGAVAGTVYVGADAIVSASPFIVAYVLQHPDQAQENLELALSALGLTPEAPPKNYKDTLADLFNRFVTEPTKEAIDKMNEDNENNSPKGNSRCP